MEQCILPSELQEEGGEQQSAQVDASDLVGEIVQSVFVEHVQAHLSAILLPRAKALSDAMQQLSADAQQVTQLSTQELRGTEEELARLTGLVVSFQQSISVVLPELQHMAPHS